MSTLLIAIPWVFNFEKGGGETYVFVAIGAIGILYSLITDYELGIAKALSMRGHLAIDFAMGVFLAASPWILGFHQDVFVPHLIFGVLIIMAALITDPGREDTPKTSGVPGNEGQRK